MFLVWFCLIIAFYQESRCHTSQPIATIPTIGQMRGTQMISAAGKVFYAFRGIPYAKPPVGELRFSEPVVADPWLGEIFDATKEGPTCIQFQTFLRFILGTEDCLKLNIYTHDIESINGTRPVMVWIHGGAWSMGSGNGITDVHGPSYFLDRDIVLVTINYRLGPLGFLSTEDEEAPGNYGLLDQSMALRWVRDHIGYFGGNSELVTIFGESAGAASVQHHLLSPHSKGLFHRAIAQSGSSLNSWAVEKSVGIYSKMLAQDLNCPISPTSELLSCLRSKPARDIAIFRKKIEILKVIPVAFGPRVDTERAFPFLPAEPKSLIEENKINSVPTITGLNENEGAFLVAVLLSNNGALMKNFSDDPVKYLRYVVNAEFRNDSDNIVNRAAAHYLSFDKPFEEQYIQIEQMISDYAFFRGIDDSVDLLSKFSNQPTYYYLYRHRSELSLPKFLGVPSNLELGVSHTDELYMMFSNNLIAPRLTSANDIKVSKILLDLWTSFAKDGVPQSELITDGWNPLQKNETRYLSIDAENPSMVNQSMPFHDRIQFLKQIL